LAHAPVDGNGGEVLLHQQLGQRDAPLHRLDKNDNLRTELIKDEITDQTRTYLAVEVKFSSEGSVILEIA
jgi:hypothetical protein